MRACLTARSAKDIDSLARKRFGISTLVLMENAGAAVAGEVLKSLRNKKRVAIFCGKGNNGGDGLVCARHLLAKGIEPDIFLAAKPAQVKGEAGTNLKILLKLKKKIVFLSRNNIKNLNISKYGLIIDSLLGVGLSGEVRGIYAELISLINASGASVISVDIPSGLDATSGKVLGVCVKADKTVTFVAPKRGMVIADGTEYCGKLIVADLGIRLR